MSNALSGVRVLEVAAWTFVPAAGAVLADWGADVIKVEHPETGDPQRGLVALGLIPGGPNAVNYIMEQPNRGKRSIGLDISTDAGREILYKLAETSDVFLTSFLPSVRQRLQIDVEHIRAVNPDIVYARGTGQGHTGDDRDKPGYDGSVYWGRGAVGAALMPAGASHPIGGRPAFGDLAGGMAIAGGIAAALVQRANSGEAPIVDVSLLGLAMWQLSPDIVASGPLRGRSDAQVQPLRGAQPPRRALPDQRRPLHHPDDAPRGPVLERVLHRRRSPRPDRRPALHRRRRPLRQS
jgi:crotonobetainyl-CoA:carnitine CoA-transferase CaiB-like acyl-CoA transferase